MALITLLFPVGLPGSGKSTYFKKHFKWDSSYGYIDADKGFKSISELFDDIYLMKQNKGYENIYIDGLFLNNKVHKAIYDENEKKYGYLLNFILFEASNAWETVEYCLYNDNLRVKSGERKKNSKINIKNLKIETTFLKEKKIKIVKERIMKYDYLEKAKKEAMENESFYESGNEYLLSNQWTSGGTYGTCWDEHGPTVVDADAPSEFDRNGFNDLMKFLDKLYTNKTKNEVDEVAHLYEDLFDEDTSSESDYYGGEQYYARHKGRFIDVVRRYYELEVGVPSNYDYDNFIEDYPEYCI